MTVMTPRPAWFTEDLQVLSARLQDAVLKLRDMSWQPKKRRFAVVVNRLQWEEGGKTRAIVVSFDDGSEDEVPVMTMQ